MKIIRIVFTLLFGALAFAPRASFAAEGGRKSVKAILVIASNEDGKSDPKLAPHEPVLKSVLRYKSYKWAGEKSASIASGATATISLAGGNQVELEADSSGAVSVRRGGQPIQLVGKPVVLLGGSAGGKGDVYAIIVTLE